MTLSVPLRITVVEPPARVAFAVQLGRAELLPPAHRMPGALAFDFELWLVTSTAPGDAPVFRGPAAQGPPDARFVYINSGVRAGDAASSWERRAKIPLGGITSALLAAWREAGTGAVIAVRTVGAARDGGPVCASVPLLDGGWQVCRL